MLKVIKKEKAEQTINMGAGLANIVVPRVQGQKAAEALLEGRLPWDNTSWIYLVNNLKDPNFSRKESKKNYPKTKKVQWSASPYHKDKGKVGHYQIIKHGKELSDYHYTKAIKLTLVRRDGKSKLYKHPKYPQLVQVGLLYGAYGVGIKYDKIFEKNADTNSKWWKFANSKKEIERLAKDKCPISFDELSKKINDPAKIPTEHNEILAGVNKENIVAIVFQIPEDATHNFALKTKLTAISRKIFIINELKIHVPIIEISQNKGYRFYTEAEQVSDLNEGKKNYFLKFLTKDFSTELSKKNVIEEANKNFSEQIQVTIKNKFSSLKELNIENFQDAYKGNINNNHSLFNRFFNNEQKEVEQMKTMKSIIKYSEKNITSNAAKTLLGL